MTDVSGVRNGQGLWLTGQFLGIAEGRSWTDRGGEEHTPAKVTVLVGRYTSTVEFVSRDAAIQALGGSEPERMAEVLLPVYARGPWDPESRKRGPVFMSGRATGEAVD